MVERCVGSANSFTFVVNLRTEDLKTTSVRFFLKNICLMSYFIKSSIPGSLNTHCVFKLFCVVLNKQTNLSSISTAILVFILYLLTIFLSCYTLLLLLLHFSMSTCLLFSALSKDHTSRRTRSQKKKLCLILQALEILWCTSDADVKRSFFGRCTTSRNYIDYAPMLHSV